MWRCNNVGDNQFKEITTIWLYIQFHSSSSSGIVLSPTHFKWYQSFQSVDDLIAELSTLIRNDFLWTSMTEDHLVQEVSNVPSFLCGDWHSLSPLWKVVCQGDAVSVSTATDRQFNQVNPHLVPGIRDRDGVQWWCWFVKLPLGPLANFTMFHLMQFDIDLFNEGMLQIRRIIYPFFCVLVNALPVVTCCDFVNSPVSSKMTASNSIIMAGFQYSDFCSSVSDNLHEE